MGTVVVDCSGTVISDWTTVLRTPTHPITIRRMPVSVSRLEPAVGRGTDGTLGVGLRVDVSTSVVGSLKRSARAGCEGSRS